MDHWEFKMLTLEERGELVFGNGQFIFSVMYYGHRECLYSYESLFVRVILGHDTEGVEGIDIIEGDDLNRFLNYIKLEF